MTKYEELSPKDKAIVDLFKYSLEFIDSSDKLYIDHLNTKEKFLRNLLYLKYEEEPFTFFKKAHKKWEMEIEKLEKELQELYIECEKFFLEKQEFYEKLKEA